jgi:hypothetical protein
MTRVTRWVLPVLLTGAVRALAADGAAIEARPSNGPTAPSAVEAPAAQPQACGCKGMAGCCSEQESRAAAPAAVPSGCGCAAKRAVAPKPQ